jgi:protein gp37
MGCTKVSAGCDHCYAETMTRNRMGIHVWGQDSRRQVTSAANWKKPLKWNRDAAEAGERQRVFCGSLCDWAEKHPDVDAVRPRLFELIRQTPWLDWLLLTKRTGRIVRCLPEDWGDGYPNVWIGTSIESNDVAFRGDQLRAVPAHVRFVSYEPAVGPLDRLDLYGIHWLIYGGESGPGWRPEGTPDDPHCWARDIQRRCKAASTAFFFKQSAAPRTEMGIELDGKIRRAWPRGREPLGFETEPVRSTATRDLPVLQTSLI